MGFIASAVAERLVASAGETGVPMSFGVLTTNSVEEALARAGDGSSNKGREAAIAAIEMASVAAQLSELKRPRPAAKP
jgi:6,7-dimethyl-8-ribityllumazine synthase